MICSRSPSDETIELGAETAVGRAGRPAEADAPPTTTTMLRRPSKRCYFFVFGFERARDTGRGGPPVSRSSVRSRLSLKKKKKNRASNLQEGDAPGDESHRLPLLPRRTPVRPADGLSNSPPDRTDRSSDRARRADRVRRPCAAGENLRQPGGGDSEKTAACGPLSSRSSSLQVPARLSVAVEPLLARARARRPASEPRGSTPAAKTPPRPIPCFLEPVRAKPFGRRPPKIGRHSTFARSLALRGRTFRAPREARKPMAAPLGERPAPRREVVSSCPSFVRSFFLSFSFPKFSIAILRS